MKEVKLDILVFAAHPDDAELSCSGMIMHQKSLGNKVGIVDLTKGELGTRGNAEIREIEAKKSSELMELDVRDNLAMQDGLFEINETNLKKVVKAIRTYKPSIVVANAPNDRHPDHGRGSDLVKRAFFLSGLVKFEVEGKGAYRPDKLVFMIQDEYIEPDFVLDVTPYWDRKKEVIAAFSTQFFDPNSQEPETPISTKDFWDFLDARGREFGRKIKVKFGEGFVHATTTSVHDITRV